MQPSTDSGGASESSRGASGRRIASDIGTAEATGSDATGVRVELIPDTPEAFLQELSKLASTDTDRNALQLLVATNDELIGTLTALIVDDVHAAIRACEADYAVCEGCVSGEIQASIRTVDSALARAESKVQAHVRSPLTESYILASDTVGPPPTMDDVLRIAMGGTPLPQPQLPIVPPSQPNPPLNPLPGPGGTGAGGCKPGEYAWMRGSDGVERCYCVRTGEQVPNSLCPVVTPPPTGEQGQCTVIPPTPGGTGTIEVPPPDKPPCPAPTDIACPPGSSWVYDYARKHWICSPGGTIPPPPGDGDWVGETTPNFCDPKQADTWAEKYRKNEPITKDRLAEMMGFSVPATPATRPGWVDSIASLVPFVKPETVAAGLLSFAGFLTRTKTANVKVKGCDGGGWALWTMVRSLVGFGKSWLGIEIGPLDTAFQYSHNFTCPTGIPAGAEIDQLFARALISEEAHSALHEANNLCRSWATLQRESKRQVLGVSEIVTLWRRGAIDKEGMDKKLREIGWTKQDDGDTIRVASANRLTPDTYVRLYLRKAITKEDLESFLKGEGFTELQTQSLLVEAQKFIPTISDILPLMVKDAFDDNIAKKYNYDFEFEKKYTELAEAWGSANGMTRQQALYFWRAHWRNPSPTQLFVALHRLREDSPNPEARKNAVKKETIAEFLRIDDMQPFWVDKVMASSYLTMTRMELKQAYFIDSMTREQVYHGLRDVGYDDYGANQILTFYDAQKMQRALATTGLLTTKKIIAAYMDRTIQHADAVNLLRTNGLNDERIVQILDSADTERAIRRKKKVIESIRRRYTVGDMGAEQVIGVLTAYGIETELADPLARQWEEDLQVRGKEITATMLCKWHGRGLITVEQFYLRLVRVGYSTIDAARIVGTCQADIAEKERKEAEKREKERKAEERRKQKERAGK